MNFSANDKHISKMLVQIIWYNNKLCYIYFWKMLVQIDYNPQTMFYDSIF